MKFQTMYQIYGTVMVLLSAFVFPDNQVLKMIMYASLLIFILIPRKWWDNWETKRRNR